MSVERDRDHCHQCGQRHENIISLERAMQVWLETPNSVQTQTSEHCRIGQRQQNPVSVVRGTRTLSLWTEKPEHCECGSRNQNNVSVDKDTTALWIVKMYYNILSVDKATRTSEYGLRPAHCECGNRHENTVNVERDSRAV